MSRKTSDSNHSDGPPAKKANPGFWKLGLKEYLEKPELAIYSDDKIVIIKDKYPKAKYHFLVLPRENIQSLKSLTAEHIDLLEYMKEKGQEQAKCCESKTEFKYGYHVVPSMSHVHLHVISQDFDSPCLKTKKHWNSFTTEYFIDSDDVVDQLKKSGKVTATSAEKSKNLLNRPLRCHRCEKEFPTMPKLKEHIVTHIPK